MQQFSCKFPDCPGHVYFDASDKSHIVRGNLLVEYLDDNSFHFTLRDAGFWEETAGITLTILQPDFAPHKEQLIAWRTADTALQEEKQRFYLTCDGPEQHTLPYDVIISNG